jgi:ketosteroid isomerase-like protein
MPRLPLFAPLLSLALLTGCYSPAPDGPAMVASAEALDQRFVDAYSRGDVDAVMNLYWHSPNLVLYPPDQLEARGWQAVRDGIAASFQAMPGAKLQLIESNYKVAGDCVIGYGKWRMLIPAPGAEGATPAELRGRYTEVAAFRDGKWVYILDHPSMPMPAK